MQHPPNLAIAVFDKGHYGETGMQASHTDAAVALTGVARACGIEAVFDIGGEAGLPHFAEHLRNAATTPFVRVAVAAEDKPRVLLEGRFRRALGGEIN